jgi:hypothetical protein
MPFCPKCGYEYREGFTTCPDCDEPLVDELPLDLEDEGSADGHSPESFIPLANLTAESYASMLADALKEAHIPAEVISSAGHFGKTGQMGPASYRPVEGGVYTVWVHDEALDEADAIGAGLFGHDWELYRLVDFEDEP